MARASFENFKICYREQKTVGNVTEEIWIFHFNPGKFLLDLEIRCVRNIFFLYLIIMIFYILNIRCFKALNNDVQNIRYWY